MGVLDRDGVTISYQVHGGGDGTALLLSHGFGSSSAMWDGNLNALGERRPVVTWDLRGHGHSQSPSDPSAYSAAASLADMAAVLDACQLGPVAVGGHSLGGYLSLAFHRAHPERVAALLLFDTGPGYKNDGARSRWNSWAVTTADSFERLGVDALSDSPEAGVGPVDPTGLALAARGILSQSDSAVIDSLPAVSVPTLILVGSDDQPFLGPADYMAAKIPGAVKAVVAHSGHAPNIDNPTDFQQLVTSFLADL